MTIYQPRIKLLRSRFTGMSTDGALVSQPENRFYLSGFDGSDGYLFITEHDCVLATDFRYTEQAAKQSPDFRIFRTEGPLSKWFPVLAAELKISKLAIETGFMTLSVYSHLNKTIADASLKLELVNTENMIENLRAVKDDIEIQGISRSAHLTDHALAYASENCLKPGISEKALAWEIEKYTREHGGELAFPTIVAGGAASAMPHAQPSERPLQKNEPVVIDMGVKSDHYCSDLTRTFWIGKPDRKFRDLYDIILQAQQKAITNIESGIAGTSADDLARKIIIGAGYGEAFGHSLGHGVGLAVHELPRLSQNSPDTLVDGMVFSIEPGIYLPGWGGIRIEDLAYLKNGKLYLLSNAGK